MIKSSIIVMDLDGTICFPNLDKRNTQERYGEAKPNYPVIEKMNSLSEKGYDFVILTARRMVTHQGDIEKIIEDVGEITENWLQAHKVPYKYIQWGKPYAMYYVDDKALLPEEFVEKQFDYQRK